MKEIGGYFGLEEFSGCEYYPDLYRINLGRTALLYLLENINCQKLLVPRLLCDSMTDICEKHGIELEYYWQDQELNPLVEAPLPAGQWLLLVNYYGQLTDSRILKAKERFGHIIVDHTHSFFQRPLRGIPTIYSCRKFFGLADGAYLSTDLLLPPIPTQDISYPRMKHILGRYEETASLHYQELHEAAASYYQAQIKTMSRLTRNLLKAIDYESVRKQRNENYRTLDALLGAVNPLSPLYQGAGSDASSPLSGEQDSDTTLSPIPSMFQAPDGPLAYPFYYKDGIALRKALAKEKIYVPTYWGNVITSCPENSVEYQCAANILALPCDHRYGRPEMERIARVISSLTAGEMGVPGSLTDTNTCEMPPETAAASHEKGDLSCSV